MKSIVSILILTLGCSIIKAEDLSRTHTYSPLEGEWVYARASEASTLFIETQYKGKETFFHINDTNDGLYLIEQRPEASMSYPIDKIERKGLDIEISYKEGANAPEKTLIYPYRDIDNAWVIIHYTPGENGVHFITPSKYLSSIEYLNE